MGHKHSKETRDKIRAARLDRSEESLAKLREHLARLNSSQKQLEHLAKLNSSPPWENLARLTKHALAVVVTNLDTGANRRIQIYGRSSKRVWRTYWSCT